MQGEIKIEELMIRDGKDEIYGKLYRPAGDGLHPAVILSHGYNGSHEEFEEDCRYLSENGYIAYAYDFCGGSTQSKSTGKTTDMTITSEKGNLKTVIDHISRMDGVNANRVFLLGASQGGFISALAADELSGKIRAMVLYFPAFCIPDDWKYKFQRPDEAPEMFDFWGMMLGKNFVKDVYGYDLIKDTGRYGGKVLIFHGNKDEVVPFIYSKRAVVRYPNARLVKMEGEGHGFSPAGGRRAREEARSFFDKCL